jgi:uncharacterized protein (DUF849 family)
MMAYVNQFSPGVGANQVVTPAAASASVTVNSQSKAVRLVNSGAGICHVRVGTGAQTATTADLPVRANSEVIIRKADGNNTVAYISAAGTTLHIQTGEGGV